MTSAATARVGYVNRNQQKVEKKTGLPGNDHNQVVYVLTCAHCGTRYGCNGSDIFQRKCPFCQAGKPGLSFNDQLGNESGRGPLITIKWEDVSTKDVLPLAWFTDDFPLISVVHEMRGPRGKKSGDAKCDVTKSGVVAVLDYRPSSYRAFNEKSEAEAGIARLTFSDLKRTKLEKIEWRPEGGKLFTVKGVFESTYELPPAPPYVPPSQPAAKVQQWVRPRPGQSLFKIALEVAYNAKCCVTGCQVTEALEAAHIDEYLAPESNNVSNGLLLRSDLHALFDVHLLAIDPETRRVHLAAAVLNDGEYAKWQGRKIYEPKDATHRPNLETLKRRWVKFKAGQRGSGHPFGSGPKGVRF